MLLFKIADDRREAIELLSVLLEYVEYTRTASKGT